MQVSGFIDRRQSNRAGPSRCSAPAKTAPCRRSGEPSSRPEEHPSPTECGMRRRLRLPPARSRPGKAVQSPRKQQGESQGISVPCHHGEQVTHRKLYSSGGCGCRPLIRGNQERFSIDRVKGLRFAIVFEDFSISPPGLINKRPYAPTNENTSIAGIYPSDVVHKPKRAPKLGAP